MRGTHVEPSDETTVNIVILAVLKLYTMSFFIELIHGSVSDRTPFALNVKCTEKWLLIVSSRNIS